MVVLPLKSLPLGFRFHPTDEELVDHYLKDKIGGIKPKIEVIPEIDVCKCEPWDLPDKSLFNMGDPEWFFFAPRDRKYPNGQRSNRATEAGYWKATGKDRKIKSRSAGNTLIGMKKTLVFHQGRAPKGERTCWIMHEYRTVDGEMDGVDNDQGAYVLCRLFKKNEESLPRRNYDKTDESDLYPLQPKPSPDDMQHVVDNVDASEKEITQDVNPQENHELLYRNIEELPDVVDSWPTGGLDDGSFPPKIEDSFSNSNIASDAADLENELVKMQQDSFLGFPEQRDANDYPHFSSPIPLADFPYYEGFNEQLAILQESDYVTKYLESVLSNQEENLFESSVGQTVTNGNVLTCKEDRVPEGHAIPNYNLLLHVNDMQQVEDVGINGGQLQLVQSNFSEKPSSYLVPEDSMDSVDYSEQLSTFNYQNEEVDIDILNSEASLGVDSPDIFQGLLDIPEAPISMNAHGASYGQVENGLVGAGIQIRPARSRHIPSRPTRQGTAVRRIRLQQEFHVGSSVCNAPRRMEDGHKTPVTCDGDKINAQTPEVEESIGSVNADEMSNFDQDEHISAEKIPNSKGDGSTSILRMRRSSNGLQHEEMASEQGALPKSRTVRCGTIPIYLAAGAAVVALIVGVSIYFRV